MHLILAAVTLASFLGIIGAEVSPDPYSVQVDYGALLNSGAPKEDLYKCKEAFKDKNCVKSSDPKDIPGCNATQLVYDTFGCCRVCPRPPRGICGGWLYKHGRCENGHECLHEILSRSDFIRNMAPEGRQDGPTGKCIPLKARLACREKNCCERAKSSNTLTCGSDGHWYPNKCFLYKADCFRNISDPITRIKTNTTGVCGPPPTAEELCPGRTIAACLTYFSEKSAPIKLYYDSKTDASCATGSTNPDTTAPAVKAPSTSPAPPEGA